MPRTPVETIGLSQAEKIREHTKFIFVLVVEINIDNYVRSYMKTVAKNEECFSDPKTYFAVRQGWPSRVTVGIIQQAVQTKRHMIVETTGRSTHIFGMLAPAVANGFTTVVVYAVAPLAAIVPRALTRKRRTGQGHPAFLTLAEICILAARNLAGFKEMGGEKAVVLFANNSGSCGTMRLLGEGDPELRNMAMKEPFEAEVRAMLLRNARSKPYTREALENDGYA